MYVGRPLGALLLPASAGCVLLILCICLRAEPSGRNEGRRLIAGQREISAIEVKRALSRYGGEDPDADTRQLLQEVGKDVVTHSEAVDWGIALRFRVGASERIADADALKGGLVIVTRGLLLRLVSRAELACLLAHELGHIVEGTNKREDVSDGWSVLLAGEAGYDPRGMIEIVEMLRSGPPTQFLSTHPDYPGRINDLGRAIRERYPDGVPLGLKR